MLNGFTPYDLAALRFGCAGILLLPIFLKAGASPTAPASAGAGASRAHRDERRRDVASPDGRAVAGPGAHGAPSVREWSPPSACSAAPGCSARRSRRGRWPGSRSCWRLACFAVGASFAPSRNVIIGDIMFMLMALLWGAIRWRCNIGRWMRSWRRPCSACSRSPIFRSWAFLPGNMGADPALDRRGARLQPGRPQHDRRLWLWGWAARTIGKGEAGRFPPLIPVIGTLTAIPILGEWPGPYQTAAVLLIVAASP